MAEAAPAPIPTAYLLAQTRDPEVARELASDHPQQYHSAQLAQGIEELAPGFVMVRRMGDLLALNKSRDVLGGGHSGPGLGSRRALIPLDLDGPEHTKWRKVLDPMFTPRKVAVFEPRVRARAEELLLTFKDNGQANVYSQWCEPLPSSIFLSILGIPSSELEHFLGFKNTILSGGREIPATKEERDAASDDLEDWFNAEYDRRERANDKGEDVLGWMMDLEVDGRPINREELLSISHLLMIAGLDTVAASLACILSYLARHPDERKRILEDPALWPSAIEELMRFESPVTGGSRKALADVQLESGTVSAGTVCAVSWSAANLDPEFFEDPLTVDLARNHNPHIAFANGWHRCLGSHLARMELRAALDVWHQHVPDYEIAPGVELRYRGNPRTPHNLDLVWS
jgi:cytochrome P450